MIEWMGAYMRSTGTYVRGTSVLLVTLAVSVCKFVHMCYCCGTCTIFAYIT